MHRLAITAILALLLVACGASGPSGADIRGAYELELPGLLKLESLELENPRNTGSEEQPVWTARTIATLALREPTFEIGTVEDGVRILEPVRAAGERFTVYGTVRSERNGDGWRHRFQNDGSANPTLGRPRGDYGPDALVAGSPEAEALLAKIAEAKEQARIAEEERLAAEAAERQRREVAAKARRERIEAAFARHEAAYAPDTIQKLNLAEGRKANLLVTASSQGGGTVWGTDTYAVGSDFAKAVMHAGLLKDGETGVVEVTRVAEPPRYRGSPRHGVDSQNYVKPVLRSPYDDRRFQGMTLRLLERIAQE